MLEMVFPKLVISVCFQRAFFHKLLKIKKYIEPLSNLYKNKQTNKQTNTQTHIQTKKQKQTNSETNVSFALLHFMSVVLGAK